MKILADESVDGDVVQRLRRDGHDVGYVAEMSPGIMDEEVLVLASEENTLLVTADKDFGELIFRQGYVKRGIVSPCGTFRGKKRRSFHWLFPRMDLNCSRLLA